MSKCYNIPTKKLKLVKTFSTIKYVTSFEQLIKKTMSENHTIRQSRSECLFVSQLPISHCLSTSQFVILFNRYDLYCKFV